MDHFGQTSSLSEMVLAQTLRMPNLTLVLFITSGRVSFLRVSVWPAYTYESCSTPVLTKYLPRTRIRKEKNLLSGSTEEASDEVERVGLLVCGVVHETKHCHRRAKLLSLIGILYDAFRNQTNEKLTPCDPERYTCPYFGQPYHSNGHRARTRSAMLVFVSLGGFSTIVLTLTHRHCS